MHSMLFTYRKLCFLLLLLFVQTGLNLSVQAQSKPRNLVQNGSFEEFPDSHPYKTKPKEFFDVDTNLYNKTYDGKTDKWYQFQIDSCYYWSSCLVRDQPVSGQCCKIEADYTPNNVPFNNPGFFFNYYTLKNDFSFKYNWSSFYRRSGPPIDDGRYTWPFEYPQDLYTYNHYRNLDFDNTVKYAFAQRYFKR